MKRLLLFLITLTSLTYGAQDKKGSGMGPLTGQFALTPENGYGSHIQESSGESYFLKRRLNKRMRVIFDVGANVGEWSLNALRWAKKAKVYAFEPFPETFNVLKKKVRNRRFLPFSLALSSETGQKEGWDWGSTPADRKTRLNGLYYRPILKGQLKKEASKVTLKTTSVDDFCAKNKIKYIDYLKIDTEGSEVDVIRGASQMIDQGKVGIIQFEYGGCYIDSKTTLKEIYTRLKKKGYSIFRLLPKGLLKLPCWDDRYENYTYCNYVAFKE